VFKLHVGLPAHQVKVEDFGFGELPDWKEWKDSVLALNR
jgi:hypothetical protein